MKFVDEVTLKVVAGRGGDGCMSFHRGPNLPKGGPDGGNGGRGGNVILQGHEALNTLVDFRFQSIVRASNGKAGGSNMKSGASGNDLVLDVPCGTTVVDEATLVTVIDITQPGQKAIVAHGGSAGRGNHSFRSSTNRAPRDYEQGKNGEEKKLRLQLKVIADVGLLGKPNAGKSTLLSVVSASKPAIADYPFTTLVPNLGVVRVDPARSFVMADIPGLIEGAAEGHGLGTRFLKHLSRTSLLLHLVEVNSTDGSDPLINLQTIEEELRRFSDALADRTIWTVLTKTDTVTQEETELVLEELRKARPNRPIHAISAVTGSGLSGLLNALADVIENEHENERTLRDSAAQDAIDDMLRRHGPKVPEDTAEDDEVEVIYRRG